VPDMERSAPPSSTSRFVRALRDDDPAGERTRIVAGMAEALTTKPYRLVTVDDICTHAWVPRATFFQHFADPEACFLATYEACAILVRAETTEAVLAGAGRPYTERIAIGMRAYLDTLAAEPGLARAFLRDVTDAGPEALRRRRAVHDGFVAMLRALAEQHRDELPAGYALHPEVAGELVEALEALILISVAEGRAEDLPRLADTATRMVHAALVVGDGPAAG
jgi:AcrR family transcriptional regulator